MDQSDSSFSWGADTFRSQTSAPTSVAAPAVPARLGRRFGALLIDSLVLAAPLYGLSQLTASLTGHRSRVLFSISQSASSGAHHVTHELFVNWTVALVIWALGFAYWVVSEAAFGRTIGKRAVGLRVQSQDGSPPTVGAIAVRNLLRVVDGQIVYLVGAVVALVSGPERLRIGDRVAGTIVVRDSARQEIPRRTLGELAAYPIAALIAAVVLGTLIGGTTQESVRDQAIEAVQAYAQARQEGNAALACSMLTVAEQQEVAAIQSGNYAQATPAGCPDYILEDVPSSHLLNPILPSLINEPLASTIGPGGTVLVAPTSDPDYVLVLVPQGGRLLLDVRGTERVEFVEGCDSRGLSPLACGCVFDALRAQDELPGDGGSASDVAQAAAGDAAGCGITSAALASGAVQS